MWGRTNAYNSGAYLTDVTTRLRQSITNGSIWSAERLQDTTYLASELKLTPWIIAGRSHIEGSTTPDALRFDKSFNLTGPNSVAAFRQAPRSAPGGIVVDLSLPNSINDRLLGVNYDIFTEQFSLNLENKGWIQIKAAIPAQIARAAMGFVLDRRVAVVDIGGFDDTPTQIWARSNGLLPRRFAPQNLEDLERSNSIISVVRYHPAIAYTKLAADLVFADELIFRVTSLDSRLHARDSVYRGFNVQEPHRLMQVDRDAIIDGQQPAKSVVWIDKLAFSCFDEECTATPQFEYSIYLGEELAPRISAWLTAHHEQLFERTPELQTLNDFAIAVAILRSAQNKRILEGASALRLVVVQEIHSPSFLCRSDAPGECETEFFQNITSISPY